MYPASFYEEVERGKKQARAMRRERHPETIKVDAWLGGHRYLFPDNRGEKAAYDQMAMLRPFRRRYGTRRVSEITALEAQDWALKYPAQVRPLKYAWRKAVLMRVTPVNVWLFVEMAPRTKPKVTAPTAEEFMAIWTRAMDGDEHTAFSDLILVAAYTGARQGGLVRLRKSNVDLRAGRITLTEKGSKTRSVPLLGPSREAMERQLHRRRFIIAHGTVSPPVWALLHGRDVQHKWRQVRGDFPHGFHSLRHYAATWLASQGVAALDIAVQLGHTTAEGKPYVRVVERTYDHHVDTEAALARIEGLVG